MTKHANASLETVLHTMKKTYPVLRTPTIST
jgi:hypothetical protein